MYRVLTVLAAATLALGACIEGESTPDAREYQDPDVDARTFPGFRDGSPCPGGASGTSGGSCDGGVPDSYFDAMVEIDAPPPCEDHTFTYVDATVSTVWVTGSWLGWPEDPASGAIVLDNLGGGVFRATTTVGAGRHTYKFILDGTTYVHDPTNPDTEDDGVGGLNSVITLCEDPPP